MENLEPPPPTPPPPHGKMARFDFCVASSLIWGGGGGWVLLFYFILSKIVVPDPHKKILRGGKARGLGEFSTVIKPSIEGKSSRRTLCYGTDEKRISQQSRSLLLEVLHGVLLSNS